MTHKNLIGISGKINSGKDTVGKVIQILDMFPDMSDQKVVEHLDKELFNTGFQVKKFAFKMKQMVSLMLGCTVEELEDRDFKEKELGEEWWYYKRIRSKLGGNFDYDLLGYSAHKHLYGNETYQLVKPTPRLLLQLTGTECGREILHPNIWVNALFADYRPKGDVRMEKDGRMTKNLVYPKWVITDFRFPNEAEAIKYRNGTLIRVERPGLLRPGKEHPSETALNNYEGFDHIIVNDGNLEDLVRKVRETIEHQNNGTQKV